MSEPKTDREFLEAIVAADDLVADIAKLDEATNDECRDALRRRRESFAAAKQHLASPESEKPTGTIFELDIFREKMERKSRERRSESGVDDDSMGLYPPYQLGLREAKVAWAAELKSLAAELKTLIDNCMKQYVHTASPESDGARISIRENDEGEWLDFHAPSGKQASVLLTGGPIVRVAVRETVAALGGDTTELFPGTQESLDSLTIRGADHG